MEDNGLRLTKFGREDGLAIAFGIAKHPNSPEQDTSYDKSIVKMNAYYIREGF